MGTVRWSQSTGGLAGGNGGAAGAGRWRRGGQGGVDGTARNCGYAETIRSSARFRVSAVTLPALHATMPAQRSVVGAVVVEPALNTRTRPTPLTTNTPSHTSAIDVLP
jgi:hypothetical protein